MQVRRARYLTVAALASAALAVVGGALPADAARRAPKPKPAPAPTVAPLPTSIIWTTIRPDLVQGLVRPSAPYLESQLLSGPGVVTPAPVVRGVADFLEHRALQPASTYTLRVRNIGVGVSPSAWATFSVTTTATFANRPPAPRNLRISSATATTLTVAWDAPTKESVRYEATLDGQVVGLPPGPYSYETLTRTFPRPAPGQTSTFSVATRDSQQNLSLPATLQVTSTSAP